jgi:hypothetical protein
LEAAASPLPPDRRVELIADLRAHIDDALGETGSADEAAVRNVLERLGRPEEIAAAAMGPSESAPRRRNSSTLETAALIALAPGGLVLLGGFADGIPSATDPSPRPHRPRPADPGGLPAPAGATGDQGRPCPTGSVAPSAATLSPPWRTPAFVLGIACKALAQ